MPSRAPAPGMPGRAPGRSGPALAAAALLFVACGGDGGTGPIASPSPPARTYAMGWAPSLPRPEEGLFFQVVDSMARVAEVTIIQQAAPWPELLSGAPMDSLVADRGGLADFLRGKGLDIVFLVDPLDGLDRRKEPPELTSLGHSILEPPIRALHDEWVRRIAQRVHPEYMGLASEVNTLAARGDSTLFAAIEDMINTLAPQVRQLSPGTQVFVSFQVDEANGFLGAESFDHFALIDDFDIDALGLSSYPVFAFDTPAEVPDDYLARFDQATDLPLIMVEGGWSSRNTQLLQATPQEQVDYFRRYETLMDGVGAKLWVLLTFTDLDIDSLGLPPDRADALSNFAFMGIMDVDLRRKPSYAEWQRIFDRPRVP
ncbi:MAG: hypothetical protein ACE5HQ_11780 [Gemmatimonadota bacterium]